MDSSSGTTLRTGTGWMGKTATDAYIGEDSNYLVLIPLISSPMRHFSLWFLCIFLTLGGLFFFLLGSDSRVDESLHLEQIWRFQQGDFALSPVLPQLPGYHLLLAGLGWLAGDSSLPVMRAFNLAFGVLLVIVFAGALQAVHHKVPANRLMQFVFFPIILPFSFLVYTDNLSLLLILLGFYLGWQRRFALAGLACFLSLLIRQNNIIWLILVAYLSYSRREKSGWGRKELPGLVRDFWVFGVDLAAFGIFVLVNGGVAVGHREFHPTGITDTGNLFFFLFLYSLFFLPAIVVRFPRIARFARNQPVITLAAAACLLVLYLFTFQTNPHAWNKIWGDYFVRNAILLFFTSHLLLKLLFFVPVLLAVLDILANPLKQPAFALTYPLTILYLLPSWLVDPRYTIIPFAFLLLFRDEENATVETDTTIYYVLTSLILLIGIRYDLFFL